MGEGFLDRVHPIAVIIDVDNTSLKFICKVLSFKIKLSEFALINNASGTSSYLGVYGEDQLQIIK